MPNDHRETSARRFGVSRDSCQVPTPRYGMDCFRAAGQRIVADLTKSTCVARGPFRGCYLLTSRMVCCASGPNRTLGLFRGRRRISFHAGDGDFLQPLERHAPLPT